MGMQINFVSIKGATQHAGMGHRRRLIISFLILL